MELFPAVRMVDVIPVEQDGETLFCLHDSLGYAQAQVALSGPAFFVATCLDGESDVRAVQEAFARQFGGAMIAEAQIREIVDFLDEQGFLFSERFQAIRDEIDGVYLRAPARPATLAGAGYPQDADELRAFIDAFFSRDGGPEGGLVAGEASSAPLPGLVAPHIDFERGASVYAHSYQRLYAHGKPAVAFVFGVAHAGLPSPFALTRKHYDTPFGVVETDRDIVDLLADACEWDAFEGETGHRTEHSIEFQAVMLAYLYGTDIKMVPILCGDLGEYPGDGPEAAAASDRFLRACAAVAGAPERRATVIAAADLAHVGRRFGDDFDIDEDVAARVAQRDEEDLAHVLRGAASEWRASVMRDANARRVCGMNCIYAALRTLDGRAVRGEMLRYDYAPDPSGGLVSFAGIALA